MDKIISMNYLVKMRNNVVYWKIINELEFLWCQVLSPMSGAFSYLKDFFVDLLGP